MMPHSLLHSLPTAGSVMPGGDRRSRPLSVHIVLALAAAAFLFPLLRVSAFFGAETEKSSAAELNLHQWGPLTLFHGLPSDHVRAIAQDAEGVLWFGTDNGLAKYDGRRIQKVQLGQISEVLALKIDKDGALWIGTAVGGFWLKRDEPIPIPETSGHTITSIAVGSDDNVYLASKQGKLFTCSTHDEGSIRVSSIGPGDARILTIDPSSNSPLPLTSLAVVGNALLVGTEGRGVLSFDGNGLKELVSPGRPYFISSLEADREGHLWIGVNKSSKDFGLYRRLVSRPSGLAEKLDSVSGRVTSLCFDGENNCWVGTESHGAFFVRRSETLKFNVQSTAGGLRSNRVYTVFVDREGVVWFGTDRGACRYDPLGPNTEIVSETEGSDFVRTLFVSADRRIWCGTRAGLFVRGNANGWIGIGDIAGKTVHAIAEDRVGNLLVGTSAGLFYRPPGVDSFIKIEKKEGSAGAGDSVRSICEFQGATYLAVYDSGLEKLEDGVRVPIWPADPADTRRREVTSLHCDGDKRIWIGTASSGVFLFDGSQVSPESGLQSLQDTAVWDITGASEDGVWFGTASGLFKYLLGELSTVLDNKDVRCVALGRSGRTAWCGTNGSGMYKIAIGPASGPASAQLDQEYGFPSDEIFSILLLAGPSGEEVVWTGTTRGIASFVPSDAPPLLRASRLLGNQEYRTEDLQRAIGLKLDYPQNSLLLELAASSTRTFPEQFHYTFLLFDPSGRPVKTKASHDPQFFMDNLKPGRYAVEARAYSSTLVPSEPLSFTFEVTASPFPFTSVALSALLALAMVALFWGYHQNRRLAGTNRLLAETRMQLARETENERSRIARDLHDQTLADLRRLLMLTYRLPKDSNGDSNDADPAVFRSEIESISTEIRRICEDLSPSALANVGLTAALHWALVEAVSHLPMDKKFEHEFICPGDLDERIQLGHAVEIQIYRIMQEAISNVCRHSSPTHVRLSVNIDEHGRLVVELEDDGGRFDVLSTNATDNATSKASGNVVTGRGLNNMRSRASLIDAKIEWKPKPGGGNLFVLSKRLPEPINREKSL